MDARIRPIRQEDAEACGTIGYQAHHTVSSAHGYPSEQPSTEYAVGLVKTLLGSPNSWGVLAENEGRIAGSIFLHVFPPSPVAAIGPLTVHPSAEGGVGRLLMNAILDEARRRQIDQVRFVQSPSHIRSLVLYTKCGFALREPLLFMQGKPPRGHSPDGYNVRAVGNDDLAACNQLCFSAHGFTRERELCHAIEQGVATIVEQDHDIVDYS